MEADYYDKIGFERFHQGDLEKQDTAKCIDIVRNGNNVYLEDERVELMGVSFYGSPYQPEFHQWAFNMERGEPLKKEWAKIPDQGIDVLLTHGPPLFHGDRVNLFSANVNPHTGCQDLRDRIKELKDVKFHVFGHVHEGYGVSVDEEIDDVMFVNASTVNFGYKVDNKPIMFYVKGRGREHCDVPSLWAADVSDGGLNGVDEQKEEDGGDAVIEQNEENVASHTSNDKHGQE